MEKRYCKLCGEETRHVTNVDDGAFVCVICQVRSSEQIQDAT